MTTRIDGQVIDQVYARREGGHVGYFCIVGGREFGPWALREYALAGMATEQRRVAARKQAKGALEKSCDDYLVSCGLGS